MSVSKHEKRSKVRRQKLTFWSVLQKLFVAGTAMWLMAFCLNATISTISPLSLSGGAQALTAVDETAEAVKEESNMSQGTGFEDQILSLNDPLVQEELEVIREASEQQAAAEAEAEAKAKVQKSAKSSSNKAEDKATAKVQKSAGKARFSQADAYLLAQIMTAEAGYRDQTEMYLVGQVVLNRVQYDVQDFKDVKSIREVLYQPGQYATQTQRFVESGKAPADLALEAAKALIDINLKGGSYYYARQSRYTSDLFFQTLTGFTSNKVVEVFRTDCGHRYLAYKK